MKTQDIQLNHKHAKGYVVELGPVNLVFITTNNGMIGCGAFDIDILDEFNYPAVKMKSSAGGSIAVVDDLLNGIVKQVNQTAAHHGVEIGQTGIEALEKL